MKTPLNNTNGHLQIHYTLSFVQAQTNYAEVEMAISGITQPFIDLKMPVWTPGSYLVREYAKNLESLTAHSAGQILSAQKTSKNTWHIVLNGATSVKVKYSLYCFEISVRNNFVNTAHGFITGASTFLYPAGMLTNPCTIHIKPYKGWHTVSTCLDMVAADLFTLHAPSYDILFDAPIEIGTQDVFDFEAAGVKYEVAMCLGGNYDKERIKKDLGKIAEKQTEVFGENPNQRYVYIIHNYAKGGGGLEHLSSTVLSVPRDSYGTEEGYQRFLALASHEHFHLWNVKRLRPIALGPFNYDAENYTTNLWIAEGFTNYYDNLIINRLGLYPIQNYLSTLCKDINLIENSPGNNVQPLYEASFDAWIKYYRPNANSNNAGISYYSKGTIIALMLDLEIINNSNTRYTLDDVMREMYTEYDKVKNRGYTNEEFKQCLEKFTGKPLDDFYEKYIYGLASIPYNQYLGYAGLQLINDNAGITQPSLGINTNVSGGAILITGVLRNGSAWVSGLNVNDEILAIDGLAVTDVASLLSGKKPGDHIVVNIIRDGLPLAIPVTLQKNNQVKYRIVDMANPSAQQKAVKSKWLKQDDPQIAIQA